MSTDYHPLSPIRMADLFSGRLKKYGVHDKSIEDSKRLADSYTILRVFSEDNDKVALFTSYEEENEIHPYRIIAAIADEFDTDIVSELDPRYWGYESFRQWNAEFCAAAAKKMEEFHKNVLNYIEGNPCNLECIGGRKRAKIATKLIKRYPELAAKDKCADLVNVIEAIEKRDYTSHDGYSETQLAKKLARLNRAVGGALALALGRVVA